MAALQKLTDEFLTCVICQDVFKDPITLHCGHTVCSPCTTLYLMRQPQAQADRSIPCPHCRALTKVPDPSKPLEEWASQFKTGFFVKGLVEAFVAEDNQEEAVLCSVCQDGGETTPAEKWCTECSEALCLKCLEMHRQYPKFRNHNTTEVSEASKVKQSAKKQFCSEHKDEQLKLFCRDCDITICQLCCSVVHRKCDSVVTLAEAYPYMKEKLTRTLEDLKTRQAKCESKINEKNNQLARLTESSEAAFEDVDSACEDFLQVIQSHQTRLRETIEENTRAAVQRLETDRDEAAGLNKKTELELEKVENALEAAQELYLYDVYKEFCSRSPDIPDGTNFLSAPCTIEVNFKDNTDKLTETISRLGLGTVEWLLDNSGVAEAPDKEKTTRQRTRQNRRHPKNDSLEKHDRSKGFQKKDKTNLSRAASVPGIADFSVFSHSQEKGQQDTKSGKPFKPVENPPLLDIFDFSFEDDTEKVHIEDMVTLLHGDQMAIVVSDWGNKKVKCITTSSASPKSFRRTKMYLHFSDHPFGLTKLSENEVAVTVSFAQKIHTFRVFPVMTFTGQIDTKERYAYICHLGTRMYVASDYSRRAIHVLSSDGNVTKVVENDQVSKGIVFTSPMPGQFLVSDTENHCVTKLTTNNKVLFKFQPYGPHRLVRNLGACMAKSGNIYVVDRGSNKVIMLNNAGKFLKIALKFYDKKERLAYISIDGQQRMFLSVEERYVHMHQLEP